MKNIQMFKTVALGAILLMGGVVTAQAITIETVTVGNPGNEANSITGRGAVSYTYEIGKYEVTNTEYATFLNAVAATDTFGLYDTNMGSSVIGGINRTGPDGSYSYATKSGFENKPVNYVSFWDATRFANWLNNGQGSGSTETGSYTLSSGGILANTIIRNGGVDWVVPSQNEWYKAAYYDPNKGGYWSRATQSETLADNTEFTATNGANYRDFDYANGGFSGPATTDVGMYVNASSFYGTYDQAGNLAEWNEAINSDRRGSSGGSWSNRSNLLSFFISGDSVAASESGNTGFRVARVAPMPIPEPSTYAAALGAVSLAVVMLRRKNVAGEAHLSF